MSDVKKLQPVVGAGVEPPARVALPAWMDEVTHGLAIRTQFVVSGNLNDRYPAPDGTHGSFVDFAEALWQILRAHGVLVLLIFDPVEGLRLHRSCDPAAREVLARHGIDIDKIAGDADHLRDLQTILAGWRQLPVALLVDQASHLRGNLEELFLSVARTSRASHPPRPKQLAGAPPGNPVFWLVDHPADLPGWFTNRNDALREVHVELPDLEDRYAYARTLWPERHDVEHRERRLLEQVALECEGETLVGMRAVAALAQAEDMALEAISDVLRVYRTGSRRNPWTAPVLRSRMAQAREILSARVKGQDAAIDKTLDILTRSITGL